MSKPYRHFSNAATALVGAPDVCATRRRTGRTECPALDEDELVALEVRRCGLLALPLITTALLAKIERDTQKLRTDLAFTLSK